MLPSFASQRVTIVNPSRSVEWGQEVISWDEPTTTVVPCVWEGANLGNQVMGTLDVAMGSRTVFLNPGAPVSASSRLRFDDDPGRDWEVIGEPSQHTSPTGAASHIMVVVRRWEAEQ